MNDGLSAETLIDRLGLAPLPAEGGFFRRVYTSPGPPLIGPDGHHRPLATAIYYLMTRESFSRLHRLPGDEVYHFYRGDAVEMLALGPAGEVRSWRLGSDVMAGEQPLVVAPGGWWQGSRPDPAGRHGYSLVGAMMAPGYIDADFTLARRAELIEAYPDCSAAIVALTDPT